MLSLQLPLRLHRYLFATTRFKKHEIESLIAAGNVTLKRQNGSLSEGLLPTTYIFPEDEVFLNKRQLPNNFQNAGVWALNKPKDMLGLRKEGHHMSGWLDSLDSRFRLTLIGRLGKEESGLILATCDGLLTRVINTPGMMKKRSLYVGRPKKKGVTTRRVQNLVNGITLSGSGVYKHVKADYINITQIKKEDTFTKWDILMDISEGGHKVGFQLLKQVGIFVDEVKRIRIGNIGLDNLRIGEGSHCKLTDNQVNSLWNSCGGQRKFYREECVRLLEKAQSNQDPLLLQWCEETLKKLEKKERKWVEKEEEPLDLSYTSEINIMGHMDITSVDLNKLDTLLESN